MIGGKIDLSSAKQNFTFNNKVYSTNGLNNKIQLKSMDYDEIDYSFVDYSQNSKNNNIAPKKTKEELEKELEELYRLKEENNGLLHPIIEEEYNNRILEIRNELGLEDDDMAEYLKMSGFEKFLTNTGTFTASVFTGFVDVGEQMLDAGAMVVGLIPSLRDDMTEFVQKDLTAQLYDNMVEEFNMNTYSAYSGWHTAGELTGTIVAYSTISLIPGGSAVTTTAGALTAGGSAAERALNSGASYEEAMLVGTFSGAIGGFTGAKFDKMTKGFETGTQTLSQATWNVFKGGAFSTIEPIVNSNLEYGVYAKDMVDENGNPLYNNAWDYYVNGGGLLNTGIAFGAGGLSSGVSSGKGYNTNKTNEGLNINQPNPNDNVFETNQSIMDANELENKIKLEMNQSKNFQGETIEKNVNTKKHKMVENALKYTDDENVSTIVECIDIYEDEVRTKVIKELVDENNNKMYNKLINEYAVKEGIGVGDISKDIKNDIWNDVVSQSALYSPDKEIVDHLVYDVLESVDKKMDYSLTTSNAYNDSLLFFEDLATGSNGSLSDVYIKNRSSSYKNGVNRDGYVGLTSTYNNSNVWFVARDLNGEVCTNVVKKMSIDDVVEVQMGSFGEPGKNQFVSSTNQYNSVSNNLVEGASPSAGKRYVDLVGEVTGLPSENATLVAEFSFELPEENLQFPHNYTPRANSQFETAGLPVRELPDGTKISMYEGIVDSVVLNNKNINDLNINLTVRDLNTGDIEAISTFFVGSDGKTYMKRIK